MNAITGRAASRAWPVGERTRKLGEAGRELSALIGRLRSENLRLGAELEAARQIQMLLLPRPCELEAIPGIEIAAFMRPVHEVGGDYYDVLQSESRVKIGIGDVTGHGLESGVLVLMVQSAVRVLHEAGECDPRRFLDRLNRAMYKNIERTDCGKHLSLGFLDLEDRRVTVSGQHEEVVVVRADGSVDRIDTVDLGLPIGLAPDISPFVATRDIAFDNGDVIVLHTDGVTEAEDPNGRLFGLERLCESARRHRGGSADEIRKGIIGDLMAHIGTQEIHDDITLIVMRRR
jgi:sigma-B regulation protein RsbU (phosphoserine phosphatase)